MTTTQNYTVTGMTCGHCVMSVTEEVQEIPGVENVDVVLETGSLTVTSSRAGRRRRREVGGRGRRVPAGMSVTARLLLFGAALVALFVGAAGIGRAVGPVEPPPRPTTATWARTPTITRHAGMARRPIHGAAQGPDGHPERLHLPARGADSRSRRRRTAWRSRSKVPTAPGDAVRRGARRGSPPHRRTPRLLRLPARPPRDGRGRHLDDGPRPDRRPVASVRRLQGDGSRRPHARQRPGRPGAATGRPSPRPPTP